MRLTAFRERPRDGIHGENAKHLDRVFGLPLRIPNLEPGHLLTSRESDGKTQA